MFNSEDVGMYEMPSVNDAGSVAAVLPVTPSPGTNAALNEYANDVDLSELLEMSPNGKSQLDCF